MRRVPFVENEYYHIMNRGVDRRNIFMDEKDVKRFIQDMDEFNTVTPIGSIYENQFKKKSKAKLGPPRSKLVDIVAYCLNPNHFHIIITPLVDGGVSKFMQRLGAGYTKYFNEKNKRQGSLFQGAFKSVHIETNAQLLHASAYVNLNDRVHKLGPRRSKSSMGEYLDGGVRQICNKDIVLGQFKSRKKYEKFANDSIEGTIEKRKKDETMEALLLE